MSDGCFTSILNKEKINSMNFFQKLQKLYDTMPKAAMYNLVNQNSPYGTFMDSCKNCYLVSNAYQNEECFYGRDIFFSRNCVDCDHIHSNELLYECLDCRHCYNGNYLQDCEQCTDSEYLFDCKGCTNCFGCAGLRQKSFYLFNEPVPKETYADRIAELKRKGHPALLAEFEKVKQKVPRLFSRQLNVENVAGDYIKNSKNVWNSYSVDESRDVLYSFEVLKSNDCCDMTFGEYAELNYECLSAFKSKNSNYCSMCWESADLEYCSTVFRSNHCFGCVYLNHREYHILNKPYSRDDYFKKVSEIKGELKRDGTYGRWFWPSTYPFEDSVAAWKRL